MKTLESKKGDQTPENIVEIAKDQIKLNSITEMLDSLDKKKEQEESADNKTYKASRDKDSSPSIHQAKQSLAGDQ